MPRIIQSVKAGLQRAGLRRPRWSRPAAAPTAPVEVQVPLTAEGRRLRERADAIAFWFHSIDLGQGVVTRGHKTPEILRHELSSLQLPDLTGRTVLDIGAWDGFYSFEAERRGASRVVALDHLVWSLDLPAYRKYSNQCRSRGESPKEGYELPEFWDANGLPGRRGFDLAHECLRSRVEPVVGDFMTMYLATLGTFDVVFYLGVLYHMRHPLVSLQRLASVTRELAVIETAAIAVPGHEHVALCEFYETNELCGDPSNWWAPNHKSLQGLLRAAGFRRVDVLTPPRREAALAGGEIIRRRLVAHAWK